MRSLARFNAGEGEMDVEQVKRWRFMVTGWDDHAVYVDADGGPNGDEPAAEFIGNFRQAQAEGDRRSELWEERTGLAAARITCESHGAARAEAKSIRD